MQYPIPNQAPATEGYVDVGDAQLCYSDTGGSGPPLVLCHPASQSSEIWVYQQPAFAAAGYRVIAYARRGHGRSSPSAPAASSSAHSQATSVGDLEKLLDHLGVAKAHVLGAAAGGITALAFAIGHPARTLSVILAGTIFALSEDLWRTAYARLDIERVRVAVSTEFLELGPAYRFSDPEGTAIFAHYSDQALRHAPPRQPTGVAVTFESLKQFHRPVFLLTGDADLYAPPPLQAMVAYHLPIVEQAIMPAVGHAGYWEKPDLFNALVLAFLASPGTASSATVSD